MEWFARRSELEQDELATEWALYAEGHGGTIFDDEPPQARLLRWMEDEFWEIDRAESGQLSRLCMDYILRDRGFEHAEQRRVLREIWRRMNAVIQEHRRQRLEKIRRGSARH